jgi:EmrB/QacA subfamily drug resistance transporter
VTARPFGPHRSVRASTARASAPHPARRWVALAVLAGSQLLIVLDATIVNVALTEIRAEFDIGAADLQWVITGYVLAFGGFLPLGGRLGDRFGQRLMFILGAAGFGLGSALCGAAWTPEVLLVGRALQGLAAAVLAPASLALLMVTFPAGRHRDRALAVWGGVSASGTAVGLILGGILAQTLSWEWIFWLSVPIAAIAVVSARAVLPENRGPGTAQFDVAGAVLVTAGLVALVFGLAEAAETGWVAVPTLPALLAAVVLLGVFARLQVVRPYALIPPRLLRNPVVLAGNLIGLALGATIYALFYFLSLFMGGTLGYDPILIGMAFLPMAVAIAVAAALAGRLILRTGLRWSLVISAVLVAVALAGLSLIAPGSTYAGNLLPALLLAGFGLGLAFVALPTAAVGSAPAQEGGIAAALFNAGQQIGGALGLAVLTAVSAARTGGSVRPGGHATPSALTEGWALSFMVASGIMVLTLPVAILMIRSPHSGPEPPLEDR